MTTRIIDYLWEYLYNEYSINGVLIISREDFSGVMDNLKKIKGEEE